MMWPNNSLAKIDPLARLNGCYLVVDDDPVTLSLS